MECRIRKSELSRFSKEENRQIILIFLLFFRINERHTSSNSTATLNFKQTKGKYSQLDLIQGNFKMTSMWEFEKYIYNK